MMGSMDLTVSLSAGLRITPAQVTLMTHTTDSASCPASAFNVTCDMPVNKSSHIVSEEPHLMALWDPRQLAQAGKLDTLPQDNFARSVNSYTVRVRCVSCFALVKVIGKIHSVQKWWYASVCSVESVSTVRDTGVSNVSPSRVVQDRHVMVWGLVISHPLQPS